MTSREDGGTASQRMTDREQRIAATGNTGSDGAGDHEVRVAKRNGIWTVSRSGIFVGDYHDPDAAMAAASQAHHRGDEADGNSELADRWQRSDEEAGR